MPTWLPLLLRLTLAALGSAMVGGAVAGAVMAVPMTLYYNPVTDWASAGTALISYLFFILPALGLGGLLGLLFMVPGTFALGTLLRWAGLRQRRVWLSTGLAGGVVAVVVHPVIGTAWAAGPTDPATLIAGAFAGIAAAWFFRWCVVRGSTSSAVGVAQR